MHNNKNLIIKDSLITKTIDYKDMYIVNIITPEITITEEVKKDELDKFVKRLILNNLSVITSCKLDGKEILKNGLYIENIKLLNMNVTIGLNNNTIHTCNFNSLETKEYFLSESELREIILSNLIKVGSTNASC